jgi:trans-aconitate 2-methyltransferase
MSFAALYAIIQPMSNYQWNASDYEKNSGQQQLWARELIGKLNLSGNESLLDIGCGDGKVSAELAAGLPGGRVLGIDSSAEMVKLAQQRFPAPDFPNLSFRQVDARCMPFEGEFTTVFSNATLHWILDHRPVLLGIANSLRPGGRILLQMGGRGNAAGIVAALEKLSAAPQWAAYFKNFEFPYGFYSPVEYSDWLVEAGLQPTRVEQVPKDMAQNGAEGLAGWLRTTWMPYTHRVPQDKQEAFIAELVALYLEGTPLDGEGRAHVAMLRLEVEAFKPL